MAALIMEQSSKFEWIKCRGYLLFFGRWLLWCCLRDRYDDICWSLQSNGISNWFGGIDGPDVICKPDAIKTYMVTKLEGGLNYFGIIDGVPVVNGQYLTQPTLNFSALAPWYTPFCGRQQHMLFQNRIFHPICAGKCVWHLHLQEQGHHWYHPKPCLSRDKL